ncbi:PAS domain S-box protein [Methanobacterium oryzae]|uniref:PAS domain S-box protein n=1 Tax=Methanobacterium oryzae TaxID=69540 RepID=UPI003D239ED3
MEYPDSKYKEIFNKSPIGIIFHDKEGNIIDANKSALEILGVPKLEYILGHNMFDYSLIAEKKEELLNKGIIDIQAPLDLNLMISPDYSLPYKKEVLFLDCTVSVTDSGFLVQIQDIGESKNVEKAFRESEEKFRVLTDSSPVAIIVYHGDRVLYVNPASESILGYPKEELLLMNFMDFVHPEYKEMVKRGVNKRMEGLHGKTSYELKIITKSGKEKWLDVSANLIQYEGRDAGIVICTDITDRKNMEEELRKSEEKSRLLVKYAPSMIYEIDFRSPKFISVNDVMCSISGYTRKELLSMNPSDLLVDESKKIFQDRINKFLAGEEIDNSLEYTGKTKDGRIVYGLLNMSFTYEDGKPVGAIVVAHDITERKKTEEKLKKSQVSLLNAQKIGKLGNWEWDLINENLEWSDEIYNIFGVGKDFDLTFESIEAMIHPDDRGKNLQYVNKLMAGETSVGYELRIIRPDGEIRHIYQNTEVSKNESGNVNKIFGIIQDITERKKVEMQLKEARDYLEEKVEERTRELEEAYNALSESEEKFRGIFNNANDMITLSEIKENGAIGKFIEVNEVGTELLGYSKEEFLDMGPNDIVHPDTSASVSEIASEMLKKGYARHESILIAKDRSKIPFEVSTHFFKLREEDMILAISRDISERKKAESALKESEEIYRKLLRESFDAWAIHSEGIILACNNSAAKILGGNLEDFIGKPVIDFVHPDYRQVVAKRNLRMYEERGSEPLFEQRFLKLDGNPIDVEVVATSLTYKGKPAIQVVFRDITERKNAEKQLKETINELERSNMELRSFAYITSHDLQEPLRTMGSYAGLLKLRYKGKLDNDADDFLDYMVGGAARMQDMIQGLLDYSRVGTRGGEFKDFNAEEALNNALSNLHSAIEEFHAIITHDPMPVIHADKMQISLVFQNLIGNALKFHREGVQPIIHIAVQKEEDGYVFSVSDNGIGIEEQYIDRIFEVFKRLHAIGEYMGAGIGLAIVKRIIERHGGRIWVESSFGKGSTFYFTIPFKA